jgi:histidinol-phosphate/aromatic aminotransferase/cobyric acid decarboxylase-like protein
MAGSNVTALFRASTAHSPSISMLNRAGGGAGQIIDFCIPCNPYFPTPAMFDAMGGKIKDILTYYPSGADTITAELCGVLGLNPQTVAMGNGSTELITWIDHLLVRESLAVPVPTFGRWTDQPMETGKRVDMFLLPEATGFGLDLNAFVQFIRTRRSRTAVVCNPNNPDGNLLSKAQVLSLCDALADLDLVIIDESFLEFADNGSEVSIVDEAVLRPNVIVLRSLGKNFGLHGVRFGYMVANPQLAGKVRSMLPKWNLNAFAEHVVFMLKEYRTEYQESLEKARRDRNSMIAQLAQMPGLTVYPSQGNFAFVRLPEGVDGSVLRDRMLAEHGVLVRECGNKVGSSSRFLRLVVRQPQDVARLISGMQQVLYGAEMQPAPIPVQQAQPQPMLAQYAGSSMALPGQSAQNGQNGGYGNTSGNGLGLVPAQGRPAAAMASPMAAPLGAPVGPPPQGQLPMTAMSRGYSSGTAAVDRLVSQG